MKKAICFSIFKAARWHWVTKKSPKHCWKTSDKIDNGLPSFQNTQQYPVKFSAMSYDEEESIQNNRGY
ncbi:hypothetical protein [Candidatus Sororendozoicomonas aggregata]|uniref:hypothetical protein n=1 Tax=Candidatus Sororendozoicomonas aggregata TaxID=3073239 RepID=UPI002ED43A30